jgi:NAD(P)-dependent dehydrogenase (short-subunit alcohol dehydrogenase family)
MESFAGRLAVVTGGGTGMGRELVVQLAAQGASVAMCDVQPDNMAQTAELARAAGPDGITITTHPCDVSDEVQVVAFRDAVLEQHATDHVDLVFNNAGIGGGGSFLTGDRAEWDKTFAVCWGGVYNCARAFVPLLVASDAGHLVNTSSVNGFWASLGPGVPHTAYSAAKFAVKGFSEALLEDFRVHAPHVQVSVVMPGHIGTDIVINSQKIHARNEPGRDTAADFRAALALRGIETDQMSDDEILNLVESFGAMFRESAPLSAADAATIILDGVKEGRWRILVGKDAEELDRAVRAEPLKAYGPGDLSLGALGGIAGS